MKKAVVLLALLFSLKTYYAQDFASMKHAMKVELGLPQALTNAAFKEFFHGIVYSHISYQYRAMGNNKLSPVFGLGLSGNYLDIANYKIVGLNQGGLLSYGGHGKIGLEVIHDESIIVDYHLKAGFLFMESINKQGNDNIRFRETFQHGFIEPGINFTYMLDDRQGVSFNVSYSIRNFRFDETHLMFNELPGFVNADLSRRTGHINFGFGYTLYLQKPKSTLE